MSKVCSKCFISKEDDEFAFKNKRLNKRQAHCRACQHKSFYLVVKDSAAYKASVRKAVKARTIEIVNFINSQKAKPCADCKITYPPYVMDFDHIKNKQLNIAECSRKGWSQSRILLEIAKCELVCANCHRIRTHTRRLDKPNQHNV